MSLHLATVLAAGCVAPNTALPPIVAGTTQIHAEPAPPPVRETSQVLDADTARREAARILQEVAKARNLAVDHNVKVDVVDKEGIRAFARDNLYETTTPDELALQGRIESALGILPLGANAEQVLLDMLEQGVLGFYDPKRKTLFIGDFVTPIMLSQVVGHEIAHGLQDMHFDLEKHSKPRPHHGDFEQARRFLIEGGAQAAYFAWRSGEDGLSVIDDRVLDAMANQTLELAGQMSEHAILVRSLQMPYTDGTATVIRIVREHGWQAIDAMYANLPETTEQMLHPDKLQRREAAIPVELDVEPLTAATGLQSVWHDDFGEAGLLAMLAEVESAGLARKAAAGWGGDAMLALDNPNTAPDARMVAPLIVGSVVWDSVADAKVFETSFRKYLDTVAPPQTFIDRRKDAVVFATNVPETLDLAQLQGATWKALRRPARAKK